MPFAKDGVFYLYYLLDYGHHNHPIVGPLGGHQYALCTSRDLVHWEDHGIALPLDFEKGEASNCTGSIVEYKGKMYALFAERSKNYKGERFRIAISADNGFHFTKLPFPKLDTPPQCHGAFRDPHGFVASDGKMHILITGQTDIESNGKILTCGQVYHYTTEDMVNFTEEKNWAQVNGAPECCDYFKMGDFYYFTYNQAWETHYRYSKNELGPWKVPENDFTNSRFCAVMKTVPWGENRRIGVGWTATWEKGNYEFGGRTVFREIKQKPDGSLWTAFVPEMIPQKLVKVYDDFTLHNPDGIAFNYLGEAGNDFRIDTTVEIIDMPLEFGLKIPDKNGSPDWYSWKITLMPRAKRAVIGFYSINHFAEIGSVEFGKTVNLKLIRTDNNIDLEINGERTLIAPGIELEGAQITAYSIHGNVKFTNVKMYEW